MKVTHDFDKENLRLVVEFQCNLLKKYYSNFVGLLKEDTTMPDGYSVSLVSPGVAKILIPIASIDKEKEALGFNVGPIMGIIDRFASSALKYELEHTEFIPLTGYPLRDLMSDIRNSVAKKRNLCVLADYDEYLRMEAERKFQFTQLYIDYGTDQWADVVLGVLSGNMEELRKKLGPQLKLTEWS